MKSTFTPTTPSTPPTTPQGVEAANKAVAVRFIHAFNNNDWDTVREVVAPGFVFHHPLGGTVQAGPEGMVSTWAGFKKMSPDSWHPIPIMIAENDYVAVLLPTYGSFSGQGEHTPPPTGGRLDYGMVNVVRLEGGQLVEMWFGMDPFVEMQQLSSTTNGFRSKPAILASKATQNRAAFRRMVSTDDAAFDNVAAFEDVVVAIGPPQGKPETTTRRVEIYRFDSDVPTRVYQREFSTNPTYEGDASTIGESSRALILRWIEEILCEHDTTRINDLVSPHLLIHPTATPGEATYYGASTWLQQQWIAFPDLTVTDTFTVTCRDIVAVRWTARGTCQGEFMGIPATSQPVEFTGVSMYRVEEAKVAEIWDTRNTIGILRQLKPEMVPHGHHH
jgi:predicted ester cyclase